MWERIVFSTNVLGGSHVACPSQPSWPCYSFSPAVICVGRTQGDTGSLEVDSVDFERVAVNFTLEELALLDPFFTEKTLRRCDVRNLWEPGLKREKKWKDHDTKY